MIIVRGAGDLATGTIYELHQAGYRVLALECEKPAAIRREVCFSEAVYEGSKTVEGVTARLAESVDEIWEIWKQREVPVLVDAAGACIREIRPLAVVDLILAKKNIGTYRDMAPLVIGAGPGFTAGEDVDIVIETMRGHEPGKAIYTGTALPNTGIPGMVGGFTKERVIHASAEGTVRHIREIGDSVKQGEVIGTIIGTENQEPVCASLTGILRGWIRDGFYVKQGMKIADIEPRQDHLSACYRRSDKAIAIAKGIRKVLEERVRLQAAFEIDAKEDHVMAVVGGGGKTTLLYELAEEFSRNGKKVIVTTTTHMVPRETEGKSIRTVGVPCEDGKISGFPKETYMQLKDTCDILLVEADGSKGRPLKVPAEHEPVIPGNADMVIGIAGASAIGKQIKECCHREELTGAFLGKNQEEKITKEDLAAVLKSESGQRKNVTQKYRMAVGQADLLTEEQRLWFEQEDIVLFSRRREEL